MKPRGPDDDALVRVLAQAARAIGRRPNVASSDGTEPGPDTPPAIMGDRSPVAAEELDHEP